MSATTPRRTSMLSTSNTPFNSSPRRVLGDLTPKAINSPSKQRLALDQRAQSPLKQVSMPPYMLTNKENMSRAGSAQAGRKRSICEVEDVENVKNATRRDMGWERPRAPMTAANLGSLPGYRNASSRPQTPTEPDTPSPEAEVINNSQTSNQSFSELVNYELCASQPSSQQPLASMPQAELNTKVNKKPSKADILRARFGMGMYKVKTNQIEKSSDKVISDWEVTSSMTMHTSASSATISYQSVPNITLSPVRHEQAIPDTQVQTPRPIPKLSGGPVLLPTAYSSRMIHEYHMAASPPQAISPQQLMSPVQIEMQTRDHRTPPGHGVQGQEEYSDDEGSNSVANQRLQQRREGEGGVRPNDPVSSVVKSDAAKRLMTLGENM